MLRMPSTTGGRVLCSMAAGIVLAIIGALLTVWITDLGLVLVVVGALLIFYGPLILAMRAAGLPEPPTEPSDHHASMLGFVLWMLESPGRSDPGARGRKRPTHS